MADPEVTEDDRRRARLLVEGSGGTFGPDLVEFFAQGIAVARTGGDTHAWLLRQVRR